jgi:predicted HTH transcriptional regulator
MKAMKTKLWEAARPDAALIKALKKRIVRGESNILEFKRRASHPDKIVREIIAFANANGGTLLIGVSDEGHLAGIKFPNEDSYAIRRALFRYCRPSIKFKEVIIPLSADRFILSYEIQPGNRKPYAMKVGHSGGEVYVRIGDKSVKASREVEEILMRDNRGENIQFTYGEHEQFLVRYLTVNSSITLATFAADSGLNRNSASRKLVQLVLANVLRIVPTEKGDYYELIFK